MSDDLSAANLSPATIDKIVAMGGAIRANGMETPWGHSDPFVILPNYMSVRSIADLLPPRRIERKVTLQEVESFCAYVNRFKEDDTLIFCNVDDGCAFNAILDYHAAAPDLKPKFCRHMASYVALETPEWVVLQEKEKQEMNQVAFAEFIEENAKMFRLPNGADLLELAKSLHGHRNARFQQTVRLDNGANSVSFEEDIVIKSQNTTKAGAYELPGIIKVGAAVYVGGEVFEISCRLKTRIQNRELTLFYEIVGYAALVRESTLALVKQVEKVTGILPLLGTP